MIKFFRKIRQQLLTENKFSKYLIYAIGEIILVVIGILIALQINNANENRKSNIQENLYLKRLLTENKEDINTFKTNILNLEKGIETIKNLSLVLNSNNVSDKKIVTATNQYFKYGSIYPIFTSSTSTFDDLSSTGNLKDIRNTKLRDELVKHYAKHKQAAEWIRIGTEWALPIDAPFSYNNNIMKFEPVSSFLFGEQSLTNQANHLRAKKEEYINNAAVHFWINKDALDKLDSLLNDTSKIIILIEKELEK
ncbi:MAG: hypothetical protein HKP59_04810 [Lutibacter sp.]|uniref:DUF6090 family protein n=1 Tax=Lutibacter sp. TaxID=1925666 RepID=UPI0017FF0FAF|nr:DUF6090 family protein [Lutibacter sp.]MBT8316923.1 hypothetical protein [Lutibacter sp.]NNJ57783.1 hypothetical protein [Lutibacter sp.]